MPALASHSQPTAINRRAQLSAPVASMAWRSRASRKQLMARDAARPPSHEHDMCQPCGGRIPSPRSQSWLESANLARLVSRPSRPHPGRPDAAGHAVKPASRLLLGSVASVDVGAAMLHP
ncbi:uncharacterized protein TrAtP1_006769 [Trichoderma atroviride]|uniref:uncharacterized protein n=1 Tax=Hypocrea atroviridis TaxID=63577 RepID=UPI003327227C|nr:hypothetical protein TrAtP1_006769 [Trichoderma atroviride]